MKNNLKKANRKKTKTNPKIVVLGGLTFVTIQQNVLCKHTLF